QIGPDGRPLPAAEELQLFVGNKNLYGFSYKYVDADEIAARAQPPEVMVAERMEYGNAIFLPRGLRLASGEEIAADAPEFAGRLEALIAEANARREQIRAIERGRIGAINRRIENLRLEARALPAAAMGDGRPAEI